MTLISHLLLGFHSLGHPFRSNLSCVHLLTWEAGRSRLGPLLPNMIPPAHSWISADMSCSCYNHGIWQSRHLICTVYALLFYLEVTLGWFINCLFRILEVNISAQISYNYSTELLDKITSPRIYKRSYLFTHLVGKPLTVMGAKLVLTWKGYIPSV